MSTITRSQGVCTGYGYLAGAGHEGMTEELDNEVIKAAKFL